MLYKNILLIDDDVEDAEMYMQIICNIHSDIKCEVATNPITAFNELLLSENLPDLLFLDLNMPCLNGYEFLQKLKKDQKLRHIDVILMSSPSEEVVKSFLPLKYELQKYMSKPHSYPVLISTLNEIIY